MKKKLNLFILTPLMVLLFGCVKDPVFTVAGGNAGIYSYVRKDIPSRDWIRDPSSSYYSLSLSLRDLSSDISKNGAVLVYISDRPVSGLYSYSAIPSVLEGIYFWVLHEPGRVELRCKSPVGGTPSRPFMMDVKIVLLTMFQAKVAKEKGITEYEDIIKEFHPVERKMMGLGDVQ